MCDFRWHCVLCSYHYVVRPPRRQRNLGSVVPMYASFVRATCSRVAGRHFRGTSMLGRWTPHLARTRSQPLTQPADRIISSPRQDTTGTYHYCRDGADDPVQSCPGCACCSVTFVLVVVNCRSLILTASAAASLHQASASSILIEMGRSTR